MCIIFAGIQFPDKELLEAAAEQNQDGIGIGFQSSKGIRYYKGLSLKELLNFSNIGEVPQIIHFRKSTVGGAIDQLCHPFPITRKEDLNNLRGYAKAIFAHNGTVGEWRQYMIPALSHSTPIPPSEHWSDSKAIAFLLDIYGIDFLSLIAESKQRFAVLDKNGLRRWGDWQTLEKDKLWSSQKITPKSQQSTFSNHTQGWSASHSAANRISSAGGTYDDRVVAIPVNNPHAHELVIVTRGKDPKPEDLGPRESPKAKLGNDVNNAHLNKYVNANATVPCRTLSIHDKSDDAIRKEHGLV